MKVPRIAIIGDFKGSNPSHVATNTALEHSAVALGVHPEHEWIATETVLEDYGSSKLTAAQGIWIAPASPYRSTEGALAAIRFGREKKVPLLGTCGGFQHIVLEYARNVLGLSDAEHEETSPQASRLLISRLACSLVGRSLTLSLHPGSIVSRVYGGTTTQEQYHCSFGVNPKYVDALRASTLRIVASDEEGLVRAVELLDHPFFVGTLFLPQLKSTASAPHPLVLAFVKASMDLQ
jgi:CTP synthase (UTP-ammonia lyase)